MLEQQQEDTGPASALMSSFGIFIGSVGMTIISLPWSDAIKVLGPMNIITGISSLTL